MIFHQNSIQLENEMTNELPYKVSVYFSDNNYTQNMNSMEAFTFTTTFRSWIAHSNLIIQSCGTGCIVYIFLDFLNKFD